MGVLDEREDDPGVGLPVRRPQFDSAVGGVGPYVIPEFPPVLDRLGLEHPALEPVEGLVVLEVGRHSRVRQCLEDLRAGRLEPGVVPVPVR